MAGRTARKFDKCGGGIVESLHTKKGAARTAPDANPVPQCDKGTASTYSLPSQYRKANRFKIDERPFALKGGRALVMDLLIDAKPAGIDRASTLKWVANLSDTIGALRACGVLLATRKGHAANYVLISDVRRDGGAL
jgi:hypothetical protein